jgi:Protein of unknown function (DUF3631)
LNANTLHQLQENVIIAALRRPTLGSTIKGAGVCEQHFPIELRTAFKIAMTKSQQEIRDLVTLRDPRIWPLYGQRIIEWSDGQVRMAARQLVDNVWRAEDVEPISAVQPDNGSKSKGEAKQDAPIYESPEKRELFEKTLAAIRQIMGGLEEISSRQLTDELTRIEGGPWSEWGDGRRRKPISQKALARLLRPHKVSPVDVGPAHARRKGYKRDQFAHLFLSRPTSSAP